MPGLLGFALKMYPRQREFLTLTGWESTHAMHGFLNCPSHLAAMEWQARSAHDFASAHVTDEEVSWEAAERALADSTAKKP